MLRGCAHRAITQARARLSATSVRSSTFHWSWPRPAWFQKDGTGKQPASLFSAGNESSSGENLATDRYRVYFHDEFSTVLELYYGSTGAFMFRAGGDGRASWMGWDGSTKQGRHGKVDFSEWLAPAVVEEAEHGAAVDRRAVAEGNFGFWNLAMVQAESKEAKDGTLAVLTNIKTPELRLLLTAGQAGPRPRRPL
jgi:hypothetical protein